MSSSEGTLPAMPWETDTATALLAYRLMERYHQVAQMFKVLREHHAQREKFDGASTVLNAEGEECHRVEATGLFNHLYRLVQHRLISPVLFVAVLEPEAASLWLEYVAPLDHQVRVRAHGHDALPLGQHPVELFYAEYAKTGRVMLLVPKTKEAVDHAPATAH